jgi:hypothetical protein
VVERDEEYVDTWGTRLRGTVFENSFWEPAMRARFGEHLKLAGKDQRTFSYGFLSATPDGVIGINGRVVAVECKTIDPRATLTEPRPAHVFQTHVQMGLLRQLTPYQPSEAILSYVDASDWSKITEYTINFDQNIYDAALDRARAIMTARAGHELEAEGWLRGGKECRYCPFTQACGIDRRRLPFADLGPVDSQFKAEITDMALSYRAYEQANAVTTEQMNRVKESIKERLREKGIRKVPGVVTWSEVKGRKIYDNKAIHDAAVACGIDIEQFVEYGDETDRLTISVGKTSS